MTATFHKYFTAKPSQVQSPWSGVQRAATPCLAARQWRVGWRARVQHGARHVVVVWHLSRQTGGAAQDGMDGWMDGGRSSSSYMVQLHAPERGELDVPRSGTADMLQVARGGRRR